MSVPNLKGNLIVGLYHFFQNPIAFVGSKFDEDVDSFRFRLPMKKIVCTRNPKIMDHVFVRNHKNYEKDFSMEQIGMALGKGLLTNTGESWFRQRRLAQPAFYKKRLEGLVNIMEELTDEYIEQLSKLRSGHKILIDEEMMKLTASIVLETLLGEKMNDDLRNIQRRIAVAKSTSSKESGCLFIYSFHKSMETIKSLKRSWNTWTISFTKSLIEENMIPPMIAI